MVRNQSISQLILAELLLCATPTFATDQTHSTQKWIEAHPIVDVDGVSGATTVQGWPFTVTHVEVPFEVPLTTVDGVEVLFVGRMDVVGEYLGGYVVVDHKTTGFINSMWTDQWAMDGRIVTGKQIGRAHV